MSKILVLFALLGALLSSPNIGAANKPIFRINVVVPNLATFSSDGENTEEVLVPISDTLTKKGWRCVLQPQKLAENNMVGQIVACLNTNTNSIVATSVICSLTQDSIDRSSLYLDDKDPGVVSTTIIMSCVNIIPTKSI